MERRRSGAVPDMNPFYSRRVSPPSLFELVKAEDPPALD
jgi:hypothetical protein